MKISKIQTHVLGTPWRNLTFVELHTDEGLTGVGEARMVGSTEPLLGYLTEVMPRHILGHDPFEIERLVQAIVRDEYARPGEIAMSGLATVEMACWDIIGKALGQPVYRLLGGKIRDKIKAYANGWYTVERTPEELYAAAQRATARGYHALKLDPFGAGYYELDYKEKIRSVSLVEAVRDAVGPEVEILVEMHGRFSPASALEMARMLEPFAPSWIEEPVPPENLKALKKVAEQSRIPIATGERIHSRYEFRELFELQAADIIQPDIGHFGGLLETKKVAAWAEACYVLVAPHNVGGPVSTAANLHLAACTPNFKIQEHFNDFVDLHVKDAAPGNPEVVDGYFALPQGPGLGVTFDPEVCERYPRQRVHFNLFEEGWHKRAGQKPGAVPPASAEPEVAATGANSDHGGDRA